MHVDHCLATYGTLAPGKPNHHHLADLGGRWTQGKVYGQLIDTGWGASMGYPALQLDPNGVAIDVHLLISERLLEFWDWLDSFEGTDYRRHEVTVETAEGPIQAWIYLSA